MSSIEKQIEALTQELRPYPAGEEWYSFSPALDPFINSGVITHNLIAQKSAPEHHRLYWILSEKSSTDKAEVEEYADCYKRLKLYQLIGKKKEKEFPLKWEEDFDLGDYGKDYPKGTDFIREPNCNGLIESDVKACVLGGVWFSREEDRLEALKICQIDKSFQEKCTKFGLGGA